MGTVETKKCHKSEPLICAYVHFVVKKPTTKVETIVVCDVVLLFRKEVNDDML
jgi:hypothetical protein